MFRKIVDHSQRYPESSPYLMLAILPFCSITVHDGVRFARNILGIKLPFDSQDINRLRNRTKSLSSKGLTLQDYSKETSNLTNRLSSYMKNHTGLLGPLFNAIQPDTSIIYHDNLPILTSYVHARYIEKENVKESPIPEKECLIQLGEDIGRAASVNCIVADAIGLSQKDCTAQQFTAISRNQHFSKLLAPLAEKGISNRACFFMLSELLTQINSVEALHDSGFFSDLLYLKFQSASLLAAVRSIKGFTNFATASPASLECSKEGARMLAEIIPRAIRREVEKTAKLRNAFVHYDFQALIGFEQYKNENPSVILEKSIKCAAGVSTRDYYIRLNNSAKDISRRINDLVELPLPSAW